MAVCTVDYDDFMSSRRTYASYNDGCAAAHALDLIGDRWTLIVVRELILGPKRFAELQRDLMGISPAILSQRLRDLEDRSIVVRRSLPAPARVDVYELTNWGKQLEAVNATPWWPACAGMVVPWVCYSSLSAQVRLPCWRVRQLCRFLGLRSDLSPRSR